MARNDILIASWQNLDPASAYSGSTIYAYAYNIYSNLSGFWTNATAPASVSARCYHVISAAPVSVVGVYGTLFDNGDGTSSYTGVSTSSLPYSVVDLSSTTGVCGLSVSLSAMCLTVDFSTTSANRFVGIRFNYGSTSFTYGCCGVDGTINGASVAPTGAAPFCYTLSATTTRWDEFIHSGMSAWDGTLLTGSDNPTGGLVNFFNTAIAFAQARKTYQDTLYCSAGWTTAHPIQPVEPANAVPLIPSAATAVTTTCGYPSSCVCAWDNMSQFVGNMTLKTDYLMSAWLSGISWYATCAQNHGWIYAPASGSSWGWDRWLASATTAATAATGTNAGQFRNAQVCGAFMGIVNTDLLYTTNIWFPAANYRLAFDKEHVQMCPTAMSTTSAYIYNQGVKETLFCLLHNFSPLDPLRAALSSEWYS